MNTKVTEPCSQRLQRMVREASRRGDHDTAALANWFMPSAVDIEQRHRHALAGLAGLAEVGAGSPRA